jgi:hypothetical protein
VSPLERPAVGTPVAIKVADGSFLPARVLSRVGDEVTLDAPSIIGAVPRPVEHDVLQLSYPCSRGMQFVDARFVSAERVPAPVWKVLLTVDEAVVHQRRRFVRAATDGPVCLTVDGGIQQVRMGRLLDVSEGGVRARVPSKGQLEGDWASVRIVVDGDAVDVSGTLLRVEPAAEGYDEIVVAFPDDHALAGRLRRFVMAEQRRARREGLR